MFKTRISYDKEKCFKFILSSAAIWLTSPYVQCQLHAINICGQAVHTVVQSNFFCLRVDVRVLGEVLKTAFQIEFVGIAHYNVQNVTLKLLNFTEFTVS